MGEIVINRGSQKIDLLSLIPFVTVTNANHIQEILSADRIEITIETVNPMLFYLGDYIIQAGRKFTLNQDPKMQKLNETHYIYNLNFEGVQYDLLRKKYFNYDSEGFYTTGDFPLTGEIDVFLVTLLNNAERDEIEYDWILGEVPQDTDTKTITFDNANCLSALQTVCEEFEQEFEIIQDIVEKTNTLNIKKIGTTLPYSFEYGMGNGLYGLSREKVSEGQVITRLYPYGSNSNIPTDYRNFSPRLKLPESFGSYIQDNAKVDLYGLVEEIKNYDDIKPTFKGIISSVGAFDANKGTMPFVCDNMDFDLNEKKTDGVSTKYLIAGTPAKIHINKGNLAGYSFELHKYTHATKTFEIKQFADERDQKFPDTATIFTFAPGDEFTLIDIIMPDIYIANAENKLKEKALEDYEKLSQNNVKYSLDIDPLFFASIDGGVDVKHLGIGDFVNIKDTALGINKTSRIISLTRDLLNFDGYKYSVDISDSYEISTVTQILQDIQTVSSQVETVIVRNKEAMLSGYRRMKELQGLVFDTDGYFDPINIKPNSIETNMLTVGAKSQQLTLESVIFTANKNNNPNLVNISNGKLVHFSIDETGIREWFLLGIEQTLLSNAPHYIYARVPRGNNTGTFLITTEQRKFDSEANFYNFLVAVLFAPQNGIRLTELMYGSTFIHGRTITTGRIQSVDGLTWFDLDTGQIKGKIEFLPDSPAYDQINNSIIIGGRNLVKKSNQFIDSSAYLVKEYDLGEDFVTAQKYTITIETRSENQNPASYFGLWDSTGSILVGNITKISTNKYQQTFTFPTGIANKKKIKIYHLPNDSTFYQIERIKLEKGTKSTDWTPAPEDVQEAITNAENSANTANALLSDISNDNKLTAQEKQALKKEYDIILAEKPQLQAQATTYGVSVTNYVNAYNNLVVYTNPLLVNLSITSDIVGTVLRSTYSTYYTAKVNLLKAVTDMVNDDLSEIGDMVNEAQQTADSALSQLTDIASDSKLTASEKQTTLNEWNRIKSEYLQNNALASSLSISVTNYQNAYNGLNSYITPLLSNLTTTSAIDGAIFRATFKGYYDQNIAITTAIANKQIENIRVGGKNIVRFSKEFIDSNAYLVKTFDLSEDFIIGQEYIVTVKNKVIPSNPSASFGLWDSSGNILITEMLQIDSVTFQRKFTFNQSIANKRKINLYRIPNDSTFYQFEWIKIEKGNKATDWTPAPEDVDVAISNANTNSANALAQAQNAINTANTASQMTNFMQTTIDGNVVATGTMLVGSANGANGGITGVIDNGIDSVSLWFGTNYANRYNAPFRTTQKGHTYLSGIEIESKKPNSNAGVKIKDGLITITRNSGIKAFEFGVVNEKEVFNIYNSDGLMVASIGDRGIVFNGYLPESYEQQDFYRFPNQSLTIAQMFADSKSRSRVLTESNGIYKQTINAPNLSAYLYFAGYNFESANNDQYNFKYFSTQNKLGAKITDGWYGVTYRRDIPQSATVEFTVEIYYIENGLPTLMEGATYTENWSWFIIQ
ncbi:coiled-coil domain-containing protein [Epilithonimonas xixisoli]|uniref:Uncharacterized protein n=1 Tax=Epilithonimonas xixisoli TaxID=1476462 RepID=A0A4R8I6J4_9FLAO|nr:hypothetical protein [Epilithonimonas xixisoli]TDX83995.1 hypothetical protein B0I22_1583 [Epilithonimonas xixisoli]